MRKVFVLSIIFLTVAGVNAVAAGTGVDFLKLSVGARATGMGEAGAAVYSGVESAWWNPAGLAKTEKRELGAMHSEAVTDASLEFVGFAYPIPKYGVAAISGVFYIIKPVPVTSSENEVLGELKWTDEAIAVSYAARVTDKVSCGAGAKAVIRSESDPIFGSSNGTAFAFDAGAIYEPPVDGLAAGLSVLNMGGGLKMSGEKKTDELPRTLRAGVSYGYKAEEDVSLLFALDVHRVLDAGWHAGGGVELKYQEKFFLRTGYTNKEGNIKGGTFGFGIILKVFEINYSNIPASEMVGYTRDNKVSVTARF